MKAVLLLLVACLLACSALVIESRKIDSLPRRSKASKALESTRLYTVDPLVSTPIVLSAVDAKEQGTATVASSTFNLGKCILGAGILSLPGGVAKFSDSASGLGPASALLLIMGLISGYTFKSIGKACSIHGVDTFAEAWGESVDKKSAVRPSPPHP
ncbi:hypothetical protein B484DRAFT_99826 [Ochromonadaceae sp. CCMP2298]|nr:hypothetical protein B484DRAFT_99826 [Ochromonadaceae sp. CCMP2298]